MPIGTWWEGLLSSWSDLKGTCRASGPHFFFLSVPKIPKISTLGFGFFLRPGEKLRKAEPSHRIDRVAYKLKGAQRSPRSPSTDSRLSTQEGVH